jgi:hypothetical protein
MQKVISEQSGCLDSEGLDTICQFCVYAADDLGISDMSFKVILTGDKEKYGIKTTAYFNPATNDVVIFVLGRHPLDICRSIAHEMTHMRQARRNFFGRKSIKDVGGFFEDQANAVAGQIVKKFIAYR